MGVFPYSIIEKADAVFRRRSFRQKLTRGGVKYEAETDVGAV